MRYSCENYLYRHLYACVCGCGGVCVCVGGGVDCCGVLGGWGAVSEQVCVCVCVFLCVYMHACMRNQVL